ncbi:hypothetical protein CLV72_105271 [Allonocardiopsis opalescens]|uniref:Uncharacterized protein n=1 Tax=Allonocardiopsis opalescens TaxID=1144618 RepID=A0A2T0Q2M1_9ACTN|nr:hypothetical protein [Allonocardiopsis opalescens]PRX97918.1 hypothetical protein CLV72_105271 [Allonocardiopsis opalescens]
MSAPAPWWRAPGRPALITFSLGAVGLAAALVLVADRLVPWLAGLPWPGIIALAGALLIAAAIGMTLTRKPSSDSEEAPPSPQPISWWWVLAGAGFVVIATWYSTAWLLDVATPEQRLEAIRAGLTVGAGTGGAVALLLAVRRQWHQEVAHRHQEKVAAETQFDATERRVTDLYTKAAGASVQAEPGREQGVQDAPGGAAEVAFDAHQFVGDGGVFGGSAQGFVEQVGVQSPADVGGGGGHQVGCEPSRDDQRPLFVVAGQGVLAAYGAGRGHVFGGGERAGVVAVVVGHVNGHVVPAQQRHGRGVDVGVVLRTLQG